MTSVQFNNFSAQRQSNAATGKSSDTMKFFKHFENILTELGWNANTVIGYGKFVLLIGSPVADADFGTIGMIAF
jgi:CRISPR/Cas system CMR subunit Cmr6 (Cas7 group RAMP superfamily)